MVYRNYNWDRCAFSYVVKKSSCKKLIDVISINFVKKENGLIRFEAIDFIYACANKELKMYDFYPHLFYSPLNHKTDIQCDKLADQLYF
jgi:hypothetical protein